MVPSHARRLACLPSRVLRRRVGAILLAIACAAALAPSAAAQQTARPRITSISQLPAFSYPLRGDVEPVVRDANSPDFATLAASVRRDIDSVMRTFDIADRGLTRELEGTLLLLDLMESRDADALARIARRRELADKIGGRRLAGVEYEAVIAARRASGTARGTTYQQEAQRALVAALRTLPFDSLANEFREAKADLGYLTEGLILGEVRGTLQPLVNQRGSLELMTARTVVRARYALLYEVPLAQAFTAAYDSVLAGRTVTAKPDIWAARSVSFQSEAGLTPVAIGIWDSGLDTALFSPQLIRSNGRVVLIGFDQFLRERNTPLADLPATLLARQDKMNALFRGMSDLDANVDSPDANAARTRLASIPADSATQFWEEVEQWNGYSHGTAVTSVAVAGNPAARIALGRMQFSHTETPNPCPSRAQADLEAAMLGRIVAFFRTSRVRVVNMSWGRPERGFLSELERCAATLPMEERVAIARYAVDTLRRAMIAGMSAAPEILFVAAAGNSGNNTEFNDFALRIDLPNLLLVGAVDQAGEEASFTNVGPLVRLYANGYQVRTLVPGGGEENASGTSFAAPAVVNVAAKMLAVRPALSTTELLEILLRTAEVREGGGNGGRRLMHPANAVAAARGR
ncbi:MAG: S8 family serine peptidase [Gemmatimonadaceae bacterium]|nr:S8 family serine peptidase [Gemmatimonadaceae bacterium]